MGFVVGIAFARTGQAQNLPKRFIPEIKSESLVCISNPVKMTSTMPPAPYISLIFHALIIPLSVNKGTALEFWNHLHNMLIDLKLLN